MARWSVAIILVIVWGALFGGVHTFSIVRDFDGSVLVDPARGGVDMIALAVRSVAGWCAGMFVAGVGVVLAAVLLSVFWRGPMASTVACAVVVALLPVLSRLFMVFGLGTGFDWRGFLICMIVLAVTAVILGLVGRSWAPLLVAPLGSMAIGFAIPFVIDEHYDRVQSQIEHERCLQDPRSGAAGLEPGGVHDYLAMYHEEDLRLRAVQALTDGPDGHLVRFFTSEWSSQDLEALERAAHDLVLCEEVSTCQYGQHGLALAWVLRAGPGGLRQVIENCGGVASCHPTEDDRPHLEAHALTLLSYDPVRELYLVEGSLRADDRAVFEETVARLADDEGSASSRTEAVVHLYIDIRPEPGVSGVFLDRSLTNRQTITLLRVFRHIPPSNGLLQDGLLPPEDHAVLETAALEALDSTDAEVVAEGQMTLDWLDRQAKLRRERGLL